MRAKPTNKTAEEPPENPRQLFAVTGFRVVDEGLNKRHEPIVEEVTEAQYKALAAGDVNWRRAREDSLRETMRGWWRRRFA